MIISVGLGEAKLMRLSLSPILGLILLATGIAGFNAGSFGVKAYVVQSPDNQPRIFSARVKGKKLILTGENFAPGAVVLIDGQPQKTRNDEGSPSTTLIAKKAGKFIPEDTAVNIQVESGNSLSEKFPFFKGQVITIADAGKAITMQVGERFLLFLVKEGYDFTPEVLDPTILRKVADVEIPGSQGVFEALRTGNTKLISTGELPCARETPACLAPAINVEFIVIVQ